MKVHPAPRKWNVTFHFEVFPQKKLRRLPHIFSKVLELPFAADADVAVEEDATAFRFVVATDSLQGDVRAHAVEIHPGVMKVVVRDTGCGPGVGDLPEGLELDRWRFRLPATTKPALASATYSGGELVVTVPKGAAPEGDDGGRETFEESGEFGRLVIVQ